MFKIQQLQLSVKPGEGFNPRNYGYSIWRRCNHRTATTKCRTAFRIYYSPVRELAKRNWRVRHRVAENALIWKHRRRRWRRNGQERGAPLPYDWKYGEHTQQVLSRQIGLLNEWKRNFIGVESFNSPAIPCTLLRLTVFFRFSSDGQKYSNIQFWILMKWLD